MARVDALVVKLGDQLHHIHAVPSGDLVQNLPEEGFQPHRCHHAVNAQRLCRAFPKRGICLDEELAHDVSFVTDWRAEIAELSRYLNARYLNSA